ncbi:MAG: SGNH/GDSL hydrolase family protein [Acidobacteria bacterium]|nr:SGNH/GDSL hydrolase family protein [Acidobacteriota bacterium]
MRRLFLFLVLAAAPAFGDSLTVVVFLDEDGDGRLGEDERIRIPGVLIEVAGRLQPSGADGRGLFDAVPPGEQTVVLQQGTLPAFHLAGPPVRAHVSGGVEVALPVRLPIGDNRAGTYMAFGDSLTEGVGSSDRAGYRARLEARLRAHFGAATVIDAGASRTIAHQGARRIAAALARHRPAYVLILYGTNDWNDQDPCDPATTCSTVRSLRRIVQRAKDAHSLPVIATLPPTRVGAGPFATPERNAWVERTNALVRALAREEGALLVDVHAALAGIPADRLFADSLHPNEAGYERIAAAFFEALIAPGPVSADGR